MVEISYIGHVLSSEGLIPDSEKVRAIQQMPGPEDKSSVNEVHGHGAVPS